MKSNTQNIQIAQPSFPNEIPDGTIDTEYEFQIIAEPVGCTFSATGLPEGLEMTPEGLIHGIPTRGAEYFSVHTTITAPDGSTMERIDQVYIEDESDFGDSEN